MTTQIASTQVNEPHGPPVPIPFLVLGQDVYLLYIVLFALINNNADAKATKGGICYKPAANNEQYELGLASKLSVRCLSESPQTEG